VTLAGEVAALRAGIARLGLEPGSRVLLALPRGPSLVEALLACLGSGLVAVPVDPSAGDAGQAGRRSLAAGCRGALLDAALPDGWVGLPAVRLGAMAGGPGEAPRTAIVEPNGPGVVFFDSAGRPYSVPVAGLLVQAAAAVDWLLGPPGERPRRLWLEAPAHHASFTAATLGALLLGVELVVPPPGIGGSAFDLAARIAAAGATAALVHGPLLGGVEPAAGEQPVDPGSLELAILEGDSVSPAAFTTLRERVLRGWVHVTCAVARPEVGGFVAGTAAGAMAVLPGCPGPALPGFDLAVADRRGRRCEAGLGGFAALVRPVPGLALELGGPEPPVLLGLHARLDRDGRLWPMGEGEVERPEVERVSASEIEALAAGLDGVDQVAVVQYMDAGGRTRSVMYLESARGAEVADAAREIIAAGVGAGAVPEAIRVVRHLPVTRSGKLLRSVLRRVAAGDLAGLEQVYDPRVIEGLVLPGTGTGEEDAR
jgi:acyl-coenzyme A synthetase/AMP-(fatty) acid ligase